MMPTTSCLRHILINRITTIIYNLQAPYRWSSVRHFDPCINIVSSIWHRNILVNTLLIDTARIEICSFVTCNGGLRWIRSRSRIYTIGRVLTIRTPFVPVRIHRCIPFKVSIVQEVFCGTGSILHFDFHFVYIDGSGVAIIHTKRNLVSAFLQGKIFSIILPLVPVSTYTCKINSFCKCPINIEIQIFCFLIAICISERNRIIGRCGNFHIECDSCINIRQCIHKSRPTVEPMVLIRLRASPQSSIFSFFYNTYTTSEEVRTEPVQKEVRGQTITVQEDHTYTIFTLSYVGDDYFADTVWQLDDKQKSYADSYAHNLTIYLHEIEEREGISTLGQINDSLIDDSSPAPSGGFGNPFNDPNWEQHITSFFGKREDVGIPGKDTTNHNGLDIAYPYGTPILAVEADTVIKAGYHVSYGNYLVINHGGGYCTLYAHCSQLLAQVGDTVNKYDTIAKVGATGDVTGNHLHICVIVDGVYVNPKGYLH